MVTLLEQISGHLGPLSIIFFMGKHQILNNQTTEFWLNFQNKLQVGSQSCWHQCFVLILRKDTLYKLWSTSSKFPTNSQIKLASSSRLVKRKLMKKQQFVKIQNIYKNLYKGTKAHQIKVWINYQPTIQVKITKIDNIFVFFSLLPFYFLFYIDYLFTFLITNKIPIWIFDLFLFNLLNLSYQV